MSGERSKLLALQEIEETLAVASSFAGVSGQVVRRLKAVLGATMMGLESGESGENESPADSTQVRVPVGQMELSLVARRDTPFTAEERAFLELAAARLARAGEGVSAPASLQGKVALLARVGRDIADSQDLQAILDAVATRFASVFPGMRAELLLQAGPDSQWRRAASFHGGQMDDPLPELASEVIAQTLGHGGTALLDAMGDLLEETAGDAGPAAIAEVYLPVQVRDRPAGLLHIQAEPAGEIDRQDLYYLEMLAGYIGIALTTGELVEEAWQQTNRLEIIYAITESARALKPLQPTLADIHSQLVRVFNVPSFFIALYDPEEELLTFPYAIDNQQQVELSPVSLDDERSLVAWVVRENRSFVTDDWEKDDPPVAGIGFDPEGPARSILCFPMQAGDEVIGVFSVQSDRPDEFDEDARHLLASIADQVAVIVRNARLYSTTQELVDTIAREYLTAASLRETVSAIGTTLDLDEVLDQLLVSMSDIVPYDAAAIGLFVGGEVVFSAQRSYLALDKKELASRNREILHRSPVVREILRRREPIWIEDVRADPRWQGVPERDYPRSWLGVPMLAGEDVIGILMLEHRQPDVYREREAWLISTLASHASLAVQNARLHEEIQRQLTELTTLYEASATINANLDQDTVLRTVVEEMVEALGVDSCTILVWNSARQELRTAAHNNRLPDNRILDGLSTLPRPEQHPIIRRVFATQQIEQFHRQAVQDEAEEVLLAAAELEALLLVPLIRREETVGLLALGETKQDRPFSQRDIRLARNLAAQAAVAVEHAHLYSQAQRRIKELSAFHQIVLQLNTPLELEVVLENITESALRLIEANNLHIYLYDGEKDAFTFCSALWRSGRRTPAVEAPRKDGLTATVVHSGEALVIDDASGHPLFQRPDAAGWGVEAIAGFPLKHGGRVIGAFTVTYLEPHTFSPDELLLMNLLADQAAVAVENARLFADAQQRLRSMSALVEMAKQVTGNLKVRSVMQTTVQTLQKLLRARASTIALISDDDQELVVEAGAGIKPEYRRVRMRLGEGVSGRAVSEQRLIYVRDTQEEANFLFFDQVLRSLLVVPLVSRNEVIGTLTVDSDRPYAFNDSDIQLMTIAAAQVSVAIANARLFEEVEERAAELAVAYEELKESDRLKDELVQNVSHELRTPLTFVRGYIDLLLEGEMGALAPRQQSALQIVAEKTNEITRLVEDIMSLQRIDADNLIWERFPMRELIKIALDCHQMSADKQNLTLKFEGPPDPAMLEADKGRINQVLDNLIGNALKFSPDGGTIEVSLETSPERLHVVVSDEGIGVPADKVGRIFDRFYQIDGSSRRRFGGAGIGLAIVKRIVDAHQGEIWVESEVNKGSAFHFTLPRRRKASEIPTPAAPS